MVDKCVLFTVDTESDNQWGISNHQSTENAKFIPRFQNLCENYGIIPAYLIDYSMSHNNNLIMYLNQKIHENKCEVGCHIHAWDTPPTNLIDKSNNGRPYLTEYPTDIMYEKVRRITDHLRNVFDAPIVSHRAGRWAMDKEYFRILDSFGYKVDCSVTPGINWNKLIGYKNGGTDYSSYKCEPLLIHNTDILELPLTISKMHCFKWEKDSSIRSNTSKLIKSIIGRNIWLRPALSSEYEMIRLIEQSQKYGMKYIEFMIHSSELMPGGSPYFNNNEDIDLLFLLLEKIFNIVTRMGFIGTSLIDFRCSISDNLQ